MHKLIFDRDDEVAQFVCKHLPRPMTPEMLGPFTTIGVMNGKDEMIAGALYNNYQGFDINFTLATTTPKWAQRGVIAAFFDYPFNQRFCTRMTMMVGSDNPRALMLPLWLGFKVEGRLRKFYDGVQDAIVIGMLRNECKWIKLKPTGNA